MFQYSQHLFSRDYTSSFCICFSSIALFYTAHFPCPPPFQISTQPQLSISFAYPLTIWRRFTQFLGTAPLYGSSFHTALSHTHSHTRTSSLSITHSLLTHSHSLILSCFFVIAHTSLSHSSQLSTSPLLSAASDSAFSVQPLCSGASCPLLSLPSHPLPYYLLLSVVSAVPSHRKP